MKKAKHKQIVINDDDQRYLNFALKLGPVIITLLFLVYLITIICIIWASSF